MDPVNVIDKFDIRYTVAFYIPEIIAGTPKIWAVSHITVIGYSDEECFVGDCMQQH